MLKGFVNIVAQMLGALAGSFLLWFMLPHSIAKHSALGANAVPHGSSVHGAFVGTCPLVSVVTAFPAECTPQFVPTSLYWCTRMLAPAHD